MQIYLIFLWRVTTSWTYSMTYVVHVGCRADGDDGGHNDGVHVNVDGPTQVETQLLILPHDHT